MKKSVLVIVSIFAIFFTGCEKDLEIIPQKQNKVETEEVSVEKVLSQVSDPNIINYLNALKKTVSQNYGNKISEEDLITFQKFVKENQYTSYTLKLNDYSSEKPYFMEFIIKIDSTDEKAGFIKYIPELPTEILDVKTFTGNIEILNLLNHRVAYNKVTNGNVVEMVDGQSASSDCYSQIGIIQHNCTHGGNHAPGESCDGPGGNDGYYELVIYTICTLYPEDLNFTAAPDSSMGSYNGGGGNNISISTVLYNLNLSSDQLGWLNTNDWFKSKLFSELLTSNSPQDVLSVRDQIISKIEFLRLNQEIYDDTFQYVVENQYSEASQNLAWDLLNNQIYESYVNATTNPISSDTTLVDTNQSSQISDIDQYLQCFTLNQAATFTLYVDQPTANSNEAWSGNPLNPDVGHTFISIRQGGIRRVLGFYPSAAVDLGNPSITGVCENNSAHEYDVAISYNITPTQLTNLINYIKSHAGGQYNLNSNNCTDFGMASARLTGLVLPSAYGTWGMPGVGSGGGDNPGQLGQNIRNLNSTPPGAVKTTSTGNAASNAGTCN